VLSEQDRRALDAIERRTADEDPQFAASMRHARPTWADRWARHGYDAIIVLAAATAALCFALALACAGMLAVAVVVATRHLRPGYLRPWFSRRRAGLRRTDW
jgi:hypothetical protein